MANAVPAGWYPVDDHSERWWDGRSWGEATRPRHGFAPAYHHQPPAYVVRDTRGAPVQLIVAWVLTIATAGYFLPWAIAATRGKSNAGAIGLLNFLLGWTVIGWVVALVMACAAHRTVVVPR